MTCSTVQCTPRAWPDRQQWPGAEADTPQEADSRAGSRQLASVSSHQLAPEVTGKGIQRRDANLKRAAVVRRIVPWQQRRPVKRHLGGAALGGLTSLA